MDTKVLCIILFVMLLSLPLILGCSDDGPAASGKAARDKPYVASVLREPFHDSDCKWAKKINTENLVGYDTREEAIADGHRACKVCRP